MSDKQKPENPPAFAATAYDMMGGGSHQEGMTLRDYFAAKALQSLITFHGSYSFCDGRDAVAKSSYDLADAMLKARQQ